MPAQRHRTPRPAASLATNATLAAAIIEANHHARGARNDDEWLQRIRCALDVGATRRKNPEKLH